MSAVSTGRRPRASRAQLGPHCLPVPFQERLVGPRAVRRKVLQAAHLIHVAVQLAQDHALDRLAPLPGQQSLGVGGEGGRMVAAREQGPEAVQVGLQGGLEPEQVAAGQLRAGAVSAAMAELQELNLVPSTYHTTSHCSVSYSSTSCA